MLLLTLSRALCRFPPPHSQQLVNPITTMEGNVDQNTSRKAADDLQQQNKAAASSGTPTGTLEQVDPNELVKKRNQVGRLISCMHCAALSQNMGMHGC